MAENQRLEIAQRQIEFGRQYTLSLLEDIDLADWYLMPPGCSSHIAWQVGHLAMAEYGLCLFRQRGRQPIDTELMNSRFRKQFSRGSQPATQTQGSPTAQQIRSTLDQVHQQTLTEIAGFSEASLNEKTELPYAAYDTKLGALLFCSHHEMLHAGQIGLLRRLLGKQPIR